MAGKWDSTLKQLIKINPQHFISWLLEGAEYIGELSPQLHSHFLAKKRSKTGLSGGLECNTTYCTIHPFIN